MQGGGGHRKPSRVTTTGVLVKAFRFCRCFNIKFSGAGLTPGQQKENESQPKLPSLGDGAIGVILKGIQSLELQEVARTWTIKKKNNGEGGNILVYRWKD